MEEEVLFNPNPITPITGATWESKTLGDIVPDLDPNVVGSLADKANAGIQKLKEDVDKSINKGLTVLESVNDVIAQTEALSSALKALQVDVDLLIGNSANTGIFLYPIGLSAQFQINSTSSYIAAIQNAFFGPDNINDSNRPNFEGDTAVVGGLLFLLGAADPGGMITKIKQLTSIFTPLGQIVGGKLDPIPNPSQEGLDDLEDQSNTTDENISALETSVSEVLSFELPTEINFENLFEQDIEVKTKTRSDEWSALRLTQLIPNLDLNIGASVGTVVSDAINTATNGVQGLIQQISNLRNSVRIIQDAANQLSTQVTATATILTDFVTNVSETGAFVHWIGKDGSITNDNAFADACISAIQNQSDPKRPQFKGDTSYLAGFLLLVGGPNPAGLANNITQIENVFGGLRKSLVAVQSALRIGS